MAAPKRAKFLSHVAIYVTIVSLLLGKSAVAQKLPDILGLVARQQEQYAPGYAARVAQWTPVVDKAAVQLFALQSAGHAVPCSTEYFTDLKWRLHYTSMANATEMQAALDALHASWQPDKLNQTWSLAQRSDGSFGSFCSSRVSQYYDALVGAVSDASVATPPPDLRYALVPAYESLSSADKIEPFLSSLRVSDVAATGLDSRDDLGGITGAMSQLVWKPPLLAYMRNHSRGLDIDDAYVAAYTSFFEAWQDSETGFWGEWYNDGGDFVKAPDLSFTFHTVSYMHKAHLKVARWPQIAATTLAMQNRTYPYGWLQRDGNSNTHNLYDVAKILHYAFDSGELSSATRASASASIATGLEWCLQSGMNAYNGSFVCDPAAGFFNSLGDCYYFGVSFLDEIEYFTHPNATSAGPWWDTTRHFPDGPRLCQAITHTMTSQGISGGLAEGALQRLHADCGSVSHAANDHEEIAAHQ